jgi:hypothetical protein
MVEGLLIKPPTTPAAADNITKQQQQQQQQQRPKPSKARKLTCMLATFIISGLMHELLLWKAVPVYPPGYWFMFFFIQAPLLIAEGLALQHMKAASLRPPQLLRIACVHLVNYCTASLFFWPPLDHYNDSLSTIAAMMTAHMTAVGSGVQSVAQQLGLPYALGLLAPIMQPLV